METPATLPAELLAEVEKVEKLCLQLHSTCEGQPLSTTLNALFSLYLELVRANGRQAEAAGALLSASFLMTAEGSAVPPPSQRH